MKPIQERAELVLTQGLKCVQYRLPKNSTLKKQPFCLALGLRYGLIGASASMFVLEMADRQEERDLRALFQYWPLMVADHVRTELFGRFPFDAGDDLPACIGRYSSTPLRMCLALRKQLLPLQKSLEIASDVYYRDHRFAIGAGTWIFKRGQAVKQFLATSEESVQFALNFFDRQRAGLDEVPEIALLGE